MENKEILVNLLKPIKQEKEIVPKIPRKRVITKDKKRWKFQESELLPENQIQYICQMSDGVYDSKISDMMEKHIHQKIGGYKAQDIHKNLYIEEKFIDFSKVLELLKTCENRCFYCKKTVHILYENVREPMQWTLERIDNEFGHNKDNVEIACLNCNLRRRTMYHERFLFTKELNIIKKSE
jgi:hypothetical protein